MISAIHPSVAVNIIKQRYPDAKPRLGIILGSGLGAVVEALKDVAVIPYTELPGFPTHLTKGHSGKLCLGRLNNTEVVCLQGRAHRYEGETYTNIKTMVRTLKLLGCQALLITNAAGSLRKELPPGSLVSITDHINLSFGNPLVGHNDDDFGERFPGMKDAYDPALRQQLHHIAKKHDLALVDGVYMGVLGPSFETAAEINLFRQFGADVVGMSTIPDVIVARHCGLSVAAISVVTNYGTGITEEEITHETTLQQADISAHNLTILIKEFAGSLS